MIKETGRVTITQEEVRVEFFIFDQVCEDMKSSEEEALEWAIARLKRALKEV